MADTIVQQSLSGVEAVNTQPDHFDRMMQLLPNEYWESSVLKAIFRAVLPELEMLIAFAKTQEAESDTQNQQYLDNEIGWGYEKLANQFYAMSANKLLEEWKFVVDVQSGDSTYIETRNRLKLILTPNQTNSEGDLAAELLPEGTLIVLTEDIANYTIQVTIDVPTAAMANAVAERINRIRPSHLGGTVEAFAFLIGDGHLIGDGKVIGLSSTLGGITI